MKLTGITVVDLTSFLPGPYLTLAMADHGAEVIKVEAPNGGDHTRHIGLSDGPSTVYFRMLNRGKKSVTLDLKTDAGREALLALCDKADVFVESYRPGVAARLGVGYEAVRARNPGIVYCSISAFGQEGPLRDRPAHSLALEAIGGMLGMNLGNDDQPAIPGVPVSDLLTALQGLSGVLMALLRRKDTGRGDFIDLSMHDATVAALPNILGPTIAEGRQPVAKHERTTGGGAFYRIYETADARHIVLAGQEPKFFNALLGALGRMDLAELCMRGPGPHQRPVMEFLEATFRTKTRDEWDTWLATLDVCYGVVNTLPEALAEPHLAARGMIERDPLGRVQLGNAIRFRDEPARLRFQEPRLGEHTEAVTGRR